LIGLPTATGRQCNACPTRVLIRPLRPFCRRTSIEVAALRPIFASKEALLPTDLAGPAFGQNRPKMLGLAALPVETPRRTKPFSRRVLLLVYGLPCIHMRSIFFGDKDLYSRHSKRRSVGAERTPSWAQK